MIRYSMWASQCLRSSILSWNLILYHTREQLIHMVGPANGIAGAVLALNQAVVLEPWQSRWKLFQGVVRHDMVGIWSSLFHFEIDILESGAMLASPFFPCIPFQCPYHVHFIIFHVFWSMRRMMQMQDVPKILCASYRLPLRRNLVLPSLGWNQRLQWSIWRLEVPVEPV